VNNVECYRDEHRAVQFIALDPLENVTDEMKIAAYERLRQIETSELADEVERRIAEE
jgi:hypothetical protein